MDRDTLWEATLGELEVSLSKANFTTWFRDTFVAEASETELIVGVPNTFAQEWLKKKYHKQLMEVLRKHLPNLHQVEYVVAQPGGAPIIKRSRNEAPMVIESTPTPTAAQTARESEAAAHTTLQKHHTFDSFIVGPANRLAHAAAKAVAADPGAARYNPLFIYGGVGLGKTHLMQAVGNEILARDPKKTIIYAPCERFASEFIASLGKGNLEGFKRRYRSADILLIDDIQFLSGKEGMQEEFFHTFNALHQDHRQLIVTSDSKPQEIPALAERLSSRFAWGMVADIQSPDYETRIAILQTKCEEKKFSLNEEIINYLARTIQSNIRELEGTLNQIITHCELYQVTPSMDVITKLLRDRSPSIKRNLDPDKVVKTVAGFFSIEKLDLLGTRRNKELVYPRQIVMYLLRNELNYSFPRIGKELGGKDHTTIIHGCDKIQRELAKNEDLQKEITQIKEQLYAVA